MIWKNEIHYRFRTLKTFCPFNLRITIASKATNIPIYREISQFPIRSCDFPHLELLQDSPFIIWNDGHFSSKIPYLPRVWTIITSNRNEIRSIAASTNCFLNGSFLKAWKATNCLDPFLPACAVETVRSSFQLPKTRFGEIMSDGNRKLRKSQTNNDRDLDAENKLDINVDTLSFESIVNLQKVIASQLSFEQYQKQREILALNSQINRATAILETIANFHIGLAKGLIEKIQNQKKLYRNVDLKITLPIHWLLLHL